MSGPQQGCHPPQLLRFRVLGLGPEAPAKKGASCELSNATLLGLGDRVAGAPSAIRENPVHVGRSPVPAARQMKTSMGIEGIMERKEVTTI